MSLLRFKAGFRADGGEAYTRGVGVRISRWRVNRLVIVPAALAFYNKSCGKRVEKTTLDTALGNENSKGTKRGEDEAK